MPLTRRGLRPEPKREKVNPLAMIRNYCDRMHSDLESQGVSFLTPDNGLHIDADYLSLPANLTNVTSRELGEYLNAFTQQKVYMRTLLGYAEMYLEEARFNYAAVSADIYKKFPKGMTETAKDREVRANPLVSPVWLEVCDCSNKVNLLSHTIESLSEIIFMLSREVSRRTGDFQEESRNNTVQRS